MDIAPLDVLCIEDTVSDFLLIQRTLRLAGLLGCCERVDSSEALTAALAERHWDLVLSDYAVPGMYFTDTLRRFLHHHRNLPLILVSGTIGEVKAMVMVEVGAWDFVPKNSLRRLAPAIRRAMQRVAAQGRESTLTMEAARMPAAEPRLR
ncbi:MAG TPA: response regulator [Burkholderiaceae bacterium]|nr:response regulator [Burkholderiaceae bacterium]